jgi:hypothetical protein
MPTKATAAGRAEYNPGRRRRSLTPRTHTMSASPSVLRVLSSLRIGERVLTRCEDGLLAAEYALFDVTDIVLRATDPVSVRESGYMTTARDALERLERAGVTPLLADAAARALAPEVAASFAWGPAARNVLVQLGPCELFDGVTFSAATQRYEGAWLDLGALTGALLLPMAPILLQALHLTSALAEVAPSTPVHLSTAAVTRERRPGERTHFRIALNAALGLPGALRNLSPLAEPIKVGSGKERRIRQALLTRVRERVSADSPPQLRAHLAGLEIALAARTMQLGPMADPELQSIERQLAGGDARGIGEHLDRLEKNQGNAPGIRYLRARAALLRGDEAPRSVAQLLSELATEEHGFHEAELGAARSWLAAGEDAHARFFARRLAENAAAPESERLIALEILDETNSTLLSDRPPPVSPTEANDFPSGGARMRPFQPLADVPPPQGVPYIASLPPGPALPPATWAPAGAVPQGTDQSARTRPKGAMALRYEPELVESLSLPLGASESALGVNDLPRTPLQARITMTRLSRDLARDYRLWYSKSLRCNVLAIDAMQQHLTHRFAGAPLSDAGVAWELRRHGALLSEILARALGGMWVDIGPTEPGYWAMAIPPSARSCPIGRVYRFVALGHHERDLVSYYLDLETRARGAEGS